jgi:hypothetical protein
MRALRIRDVITASSCGLLAAACGSGSGGGGDPVNGTWTQPNGTVAIPAALGGGSLSDDATLSFDDAASPSAFDLTMALSFQGLTDTFDVHGTYTESGGNLTLDFAGFTIASGSSDTQAVGAGGSPCVTLTPLAGATVCFPTPQTDSYQIAGGTLTVSIENEIVGAPAAPTTLTLTRSQ